MPTDATTRQEGAHFLVPEAAARVVEACQAKPGESILDAGAGLGALTLPLSQAVAPGGTVYAVESHPERADVLRSHAWPGVKVQQGDILAVRIPSVDAVVANPPYKIIPAILRRLLELPLEKPIGRMILVVPRELAERLTAPVGSPEYGRLTVETALRGKTRVLFTLRRGDFEPRPFVDSSVIRIDPKPFVEPRRLGALLDAAWERKKATLRHSLSPLAALLGVPPVAITEALATVNAEKGRTAMDLSPYEYGVLAQALTRAAPPRDL